MHLVNVLCYNFDILKGGSFLGAGTVTKVQFFSNCLQEDVDLLLYVPANYTSLNKYNILIASDGNDYFQLGGIKRLADKLHSNNLIKNLIIVGIPYKNVEDRKNKYIPTGSQHEAYLRFLAYELLPYFEREYSISEDPKARALIGDSMAGTVSLLASLQYPHIFGKVILQSPYVDQYVLDIVSKTKNVNLSIFHIIGKKEDKVVRLDKTIANFLSPNRQLHQLLKQKNFDLFYEEFEGNHSWKFWKLYLEKALIHLFN